MSRGKKLKCTGGKGLKLKEKAMRHLRTSGNGSAQKVFRLKLEKVWDAQNCTCGAFCFSLKG